MYEELLRIKRHRQDAAANAVTRQKRAVEDAVQAVRDAKSEVVTFRGFRIDKEAGLFEEIRGSEVVVRDLEDMKRKVALLREKEAALETAVLDVEKALEAEQEKLTELQELHMEAVRAREKFDEFVAHHSEIEHMQQNAREEAEAEEVTTASFNGAGRTR